MQDTTMEFRDTMISARDFGRLTSFYRELCGLMETERTDNYCTLQDPRGGQLLCITNGPSIGRPGPGVAVGDIATALATLEKLGGKVLKRWEFGPMKGANCEDPEGNELLLWQGSHGVAPKYPRAETVIACYTPKAGKAAELKRILARHVPTLRELGFATSTPVTLLQAADGTYLEIFEWVGGEAAEQAHHHPRVQELWDALGEVTAFRPLGALAEADKPFSHFRRVQL